MGAAPTVRDRGGRVSALVAVCVLVTLAAPVAAADAGGHRYVSARGSDRNPCTRSKPCRTLDRAYRKAKPGQVVVIRRGRYRAQRIQFDRRKRSARKVVFRPAKGARVVVRGNLTVFARHVEFRGMRVGRWSAVAPASDVVFRSVRSGRFVIAGARRVRVLGGSMGPAVNRSNVISARSSRSLRPPRNVVLDGVTIRGFRRTRTKPRVSCLEVRTVDGLTVRRSRFADCHDYAVLFVKGGRAGPPTDVTLENNVLGCCREGSRTIRVLGGRRETWRDFRVRNNSMTGAIAVDTARSRVRSVHFVSNVAASFEGCGLSGVSSDYNVWRAGTACGPNDVVAPSDFVDPSAGNFDLLPGAAAIDLGAPGGKHPAADFDGQRRPVGDAPDAGAYETLASGLVAAFAFDELAGVTVADSSGLGNTGIAWGPARTGSGRFGRALEFDGRDDWVTIADASSLDLRSELTLEAWVRPEALGTSWRTVLIKEQADDLVYALYANTSTRNASGHVFVGGDRETRTRRQLPLGVWTHLAATFDGSTLRVYVNGREAARRDVRGDLAGSAGPVRLGGNDVWDEWFDGEIDEVRIYRRALSPDQLSKDMRKPVRGGSASEAPASPVDSEAPTSPGGFALAERSETSVSVDWEAAGDDVGVAGYGLYRDGVRVGSSGASSRSFTFGELDCGSSYELGVDAVDAAGNRSGQVTLSATTRECPLPDTQSPTSPPGLTVTGQTSSSVTVAWGAATDDVGVVGYDVYRDGSRVGTTAAGTRSYTFSGLPCGTSFSFGLDAFDTAGNRSGRVMLSAASSECPPPDTQAPTAPGGLVLAGRSETSVSVDWEAAGDDVGVAGYGLYRDGVRVGSSGASSRSFTFGELDCGSSYELGVDAVDAAGNRSGRVTLSAATTTCPAPGAADLYLSPSGSDSSSCTQSSPCRTFDRAYQAADPGDVVELTGGSYGSQTVDADSSKASQIDVVFRPAAGAGVSVGYLQVYGKHMEFRSLATSGWYVRPGADDITFRNVRTHGTIFITSASNVSVIGGEVELEGEYAESDSQIKSASVSATPPTNILIDGVNFHDWARAPGSAAHIECLQFGSGVNVTIRNSRFENCATQGVFVNSWYANASWRIENWLVENNWFDRTLTGYNSLIFAGSEGTTLNGDVVVRYNSFAQAPRGASNWFNFEWIGNVGDLSACVSGHTYSRNVWTSAKCSFTDKTAPSGFVDVSGFDLRLRPDAAAIDAGDPAVFPAADMFGGGRPKGSAPDAGAHEAG